MSHRKLLAILISFMLVTVVAELTVDWVFAEDSQAAVTANRKAYISAIVEKWQTEAVLMGFAETWSQEFTAALVKANVKQLLAVQAATSYDAVRAILQGRPAPVAVEGRVGVQNLGDLTTDLTFTPLNPPCRIFDTRNYGGCVAPSGGTTRNYYVYGKF